MSATAELALPHVGEIVADKYRVEHSLGEGGMAHVFAAHHELLDKPIALKVLSRLSRSDVLDRDRRVKTFVDRFLAEARAAARIDSPHVTRVMEIGTLPNGLPYMVMERLVGCDLEQLLGRERLPIETVVDYALQALDGVAHAHALGIVHRDLKPANLYLCEQKDGEAIVKVMDFGIAKFTDSDIHAGKLTGDGGAVGSPMYMAPEQVRNASAVDERADIWAMGIVLYELLTGVTPFEGTEVGQIFAAILEKPIVHARTLRPEIPRRLDDAIMMCLERDPAKRCSNVVELARHLEPFASKRWAPLVKNIERTLASGNRSSGIRPASMPRISEPSLPTLDEVVPPPRWRRALWIPLAGALAIGLFLAVRGPIARAREPAAPIQSMSIATTTAPTGSAVAAPIEIELPDTQPAPTTAPPPRAKSTKPTPSASASASSSAKGPTHFFDERF